MRTEFFSGVMQGPSLVETIRTDGLRRITSLNQEQATVTPLTRFLAERGFVLSARERKVLSSTEAQIDSERRAILAARTMLGQRFLEFRKTPIIGDYLYQRKSRVERNPNDLQEVTVHGKGQSFVTLESMLARFLECDPTFVSKANITFHDSSISVVVDSRIFQREIGKISRHTENTGAVSGYRLTFWIGDNKYTLPVSLINAKFGNPVEAAEHENLHIQQSYLQPKSAYDDYSEEIVFAKIKEDIKRASKLSSMEAFRTTVARITEERFMDYLNELAAYALTGTIGVYDSFYGNSTDAYANISNEMQNAMLDAISNHPRKESFIRIINEELKKTRDRAKFIYKGYEELLMKAKREGKLSGEEIANIIMFLTPEQGFLINAYLQDAPPTITQMKQWMNEYRS